VANLQLRRSILLALCQGHGKIHLLEFTQTIMQLPREVGHRSIIIIYFILKLREHDGRVM
jgi:hypothetical protein